jgi:TPR repeat protein
MTAYEDGIRAYERRDHKTALELLLPFARQDKAEAQCLIGIMYEEGWGVSRDSAAAFIWYRKAADQENAAAQFYLAGMYDNSREYAVAVMWLRKAADQGHAGAQFNLAVMYEEGQGAPQDDTAAASWYRKAADQGQANARLNLGVYREQGRGGLLKDEREAARLYKLAADQGLAGAQCNLGVLYEQGRGGLPKDDREAVYLYRLAADQGNAFGRCKLAFFYSEGHGGLPKDDHEAARLFKLAADQEHATAQNNLGAMYASGRGGLPKDDHEAARLYKLAADQGDALGQANLGVFYLEGRGGLSRDDCEATRLFKLAADQGNATAQSKLGAMDAGRRAPPKDDPAHPNELATDQTRAAQRDLVGVFSGNGRSGLMSGWFKSNSSLAVDILNRAGDWGNFIFWSPIAAAFFFGWLFAVVTAGLAVIAFGLLSWWASWAPCPHGIPRGKTENLCERCVCKQKEIEENHRREREIRERQERIDAAAAGLRDDERSRLAKSLVPKIEELRGLSWQQFEDEVSRMYERIGFKVRQTPYANDHGLDAILWKDDKKYLLQCKKYGEGGSSGRPELQQFYGVVAADNAAVSGFFVTTSRFTNEAIEFAEKVRRIKLIDQDDLLRMMFDSKPDAAEDDSYRSMCPQCEDIVSHRLRTPQTARCRNGHKVGPTLDFESLLPASARPRKTRRGRRGFEEPKGYAIDATTDEGQKKLAVILGAGLETAREAIVGNTYPVKDQLSALGGRWNPDRKAWMVPVDKAEVARSLVNGLSFGAAPNLSSSKDSGENGGRGADLPTTWNGVSQQGIRPGDRITIRYLDDNKTASLTLNHERNDPTNGVLTVASPLGKQVLGLVEGDEAEFEVAGRSRPILIVRVER